jgi:hypothetical protein
MSEPKHTAATDQQGNDEGPEMSPSEAEGLAYVLAQLNLSAIRRGARARWVVRQEAGSPPTKPPPKP